MLLQRTITLALTTCLATGATFLASPGAHAAPMETLESLQEALDECRPVALTHDIIAPDRTLAIHCSAALDLNGHRLAVYRVATDFDKATTFTIDDTGQGGHLTADAARPSPDQADPGEYREGYPGISTDGANIIVNGGTVTATGGAGGFHDPDTGGDWLDWSGPGIGALWSHEGAVTINGGTVTATGGPGAAGIGGGGGDGGRRLAVTGLNLTVNGGTVRATGGAPTEIAGHLAGGSGIGSGNGTTADARADSGTTTVNDGTVIATGGSGRPAVGADHTIGGTGIGGGTNRPAGTLIVNGGAVTARGGDSTHSTTGQVEPGGMGIGAGLGGGSSADQVGAQGATTIEAGATLTASGGDTILLTEGGEVPDPYTGAPLGLVASGDVTGDLTVAGTLRLPGGTATMGATATVTSTGKILGTIADPTVGATLAAHQSHGTITNDGVIALSADRVTVGVTGQNHLVTFDARNGSAAEPVTVFARSFADGYRTIPTPVRDGYEFLGWNTEAGGGGTALTATTELSGSFTAYARWVGTAVTVEKPVIAGVPVVDGTLTVTPGALSPAAAVSAYVWTSGEAELGTGPTYTVKPADVGKSITVTQSASHPDSATGLATSEPTAVVAKATFSAVPTASFGGVLKVGETLTAVEGTSTPAPDEHAYQWFAGQDPIGGATSRTYTLTNAEQGKSIKVRITAIRAGYVDAPTTSPASVAPVATDRAPHLSLGTSASSLRLGQSATLRWESADATTLNASGEWSGARGSAGDHRVTPSSVGTSIYVLTAENPNGRTTAQIAIAVSLPAATLQVTAPSSSVAGKTIRVTGRGLAAGEPFTLAIADNRVASGRADGSGSVTVTVRVPTALVRGTHLVRITGSSVDRRGEVRTKIAKKNRLKLRLSRAAVRANGKQRLTIARLEPGEKVVVTYRGKRISAKRAKANRKGVYSVTFRVGSKRGLKPVRVTAQYNPEKRSKSFRVIG